MKKFIKKNYARHKEKINNFFWRSLQIFGKQGFSFLSFLVFVALLTPYNYGVYTYIMATVMLLTMFADFGISGATAKYVAEYNATDKNKLRRLPYNSGIVILGITIFVTIITILFGKPFLGEYYTFMLYTLPMIFLVPMMGLYSGVYSGLKKFKTLANISLIVGAVSLALNYILVRMFSIYGAIIGQNLFYLILLIVLALGYREIDFKIDRSIMKPVMKYSLIIGLTTISYYLYTRADIVVLGKFGYITEIAYYNILNKLLDVIVLPFSIYAAISSPNITALYSKKLYNEVKKDYVSHIRYLLVIGIVIAIAAYFIVPIIISMFFSKYFTPTTLLMFKWLVILLPVQVIASYVGGAHTSATGNAHFSLWPMVIAGVLNVVLDIFFIMRFGFIGVMYSTFLCYTFAITANAILYYRKLLRLTR